MAESAGTGTVRKVVMVSDATYGGAAIACRRLYSALRRQGRYRPRWIAGHGRYDLADLVAERRPGLGETLLRRAIARLQVPGGPDIRRYRAAANRWCNARDLRRLVVQERPAVVHLHNLHEWVSFRFLEMLPRDVPLVWSLHDMWPLTGYCFLALDCERYRDGCGEACPEAGMWGGMPRSVRAEWRRRQRFYLRNASRLVMVSPSAWGADMARQRFGNMVRVEKIANCLDLDTFRPLGSKAAVRETLGVPVHGPVVLLGAMGITTRAKGFDDIVTALGKVRQKHKMDFTVVAFGVVGEGVSLPGQWIHAGRIDDERLLNMYYNCADVFISASRVEMFGYTLAESIAAGTPCVAYRTGACSEIIRHGQTGYLAQPGSADDLADGLHRVLRLSISNQGQARQNCRTAAEETFGMAGPAARYADVMDDVVDRVGAQW